MSSAVRDRLLIGFFCWLASLGWLKGQNLVPNPSFEISLKPVCQFLIFQFADSTAQNIGDYIQDWYTPTEGTTDPWFYNDTLRIGPPPSNQCTQNLKRLGLTARTGRRCIGLDNSGQVNGAVTPPTYREYIQVKLTQPLRPGVVYAVSFYLRRSPEAGTATNNFGALLTTQPLKRYEGNAHAYGRHLLPGRPQVNQTAVVQSTQEWTPVSGCFTADSAYQYLTLGNFFSDEQTTFVNYSGFANQSLFNYYLLDDVSVSEANTAFIPPPLQAGKDTTLCPHSVYSVSLPTLPAGHYRWQDGDTSAHYLIQQSGTYWVTATSGLCVSSDTFRVQVAPAIRLPSDTVVCAEAPFWLKPLGDPLAHVWNDGSSSDSLRVSQTGTYWVSTTAAHCVTADTIAVQVLACPGEIPNVFTPNGDGKNDTFWVDGIEALPWELRIFNRWGAPIYRSYPYHNEWNGQDAPAGTYYYWLNSPRLKRSLKGWVSLIR